MNIQLKNYSVMKPEFEVKQISGDDYDAQLVIEPLESGYGHTVGNALRRVLLTSLPGVGITSVRIEGIEHQFDTLEGLREDIVDLILNLKQVRIRALGEENKGVFTLEVKGSGKEVKAKDITLASGFEIVNPELYLATLAEGKKLSVEMTVEAGIGYLMANERSQSAVIGEIPIDTLFSPVIKVSYKVEATRVGRRTDFDKVLLNITTDGSITAKAALKAAAQILASQFTQIFEPVLPQVEPEESSLSPEEAEVLRLTVEELDLPTRIANALRKGGFKTVGDLVNVPKDLVAKVKNLGEKSVDVINEALDKKGVTLGE